MHRSFTRLWAAVAVSGLGDGVRAGALPLLAAFVTGSPAQLAGVAFAQALPWLLFGLVSGVVADRRDRRALLVWANAVRGAVMACVVVSVAIGVTPLPLLYGAAFVLSSVTVFADSASQALLPDIVPRDQLARANGRLYTTETTVAQFAGPPLGSLLFAAGAAVPFAVDSVSFAAGAVLMTGVRGATPARVATGGLLREIAAGFAWLRRQPVLWYTIALSSASNIGSEMIFGVFPLFALRLLHVPAAAYGLLFLCYAVGAVAGGMSATRVAMLVGDGPAITGSVVLFGAPLLAMALWPHALVAAALMAASGIGEGVWGVVVMSLRQAVVPEPIRGRVLATLRLFSWGTASIGAALGGIVGQTLGVADAGVIGGAVVVGTALAVAPALRTSAIRRLREA